MTICYFGMYRPTAPRDKVYLEGLGGLGVNVIECVDSSRGLLKFVCLARKLFALRGRYDVLWVGYLSGITAPVARLVTRKKIVWNILNSQYERVVLNRRMHARFSPTAWFFWIVERLSFASSDAVLVETESQKEFLIKTFHAKPQKLKVVFTSADPSVFFPDPSVKKRERFTAVFRGMLLPEVGIEHILDAARLLKDEPIDFVLIGWGMLLEKTKRTLGEYRLQNVTLTEVFLEPKALRELMLSCHVMLGQFGDHPHLEHTIQNKTFEALALGLPYLTRDSRSNRELLVSGENCLFVPADVPQARAIADAILRLRDDAELREKLSCGARATYEARLTPAVLGREVLGILTQIKTPHKV